MKILMATGGSPHSEAALGFGTYLLHTWRTEKTVTVLTVIKRESDYAKANLILTHARQLLAPETQTVQTKVRVGHPAEEILREAEEGGYGLLIVGEREHHKLMTRFLLGSTAVRVVEHAPCPVIIAKGQIGPIHRLLLCDSGADQPSLLSRFVGQLAGLLRGDEKITILHVMSQIGAGPGVVGEQLRAQAEKLIAEHTPEGELLERDIQILEELGVHPQPKVRHGLVVDEILAEAKEGEHDLVVIGTNPGQGWRRILLDDLAHQIILKMDRPILVVR
jgi:nucleotide-binding universal stress UspA family protein